MRALLALVGAALGVKLAPYGSLFFGSVVGALIGLGFAQIILMGRRLASLEDQVRQLRADLARSMPASQRDARADAQSQTAPSAPDAAAAAAPMVPMATTLPAEQPPIVQWVRDFIAGGNTLVRAGVLVLIFGVAFLLRYLSEHTHVPIGYRLSGVAGGALVLWGVGWRLRRRRPGYALALQGGGFGVLYLVVYAALRLFALLSAASALPLLALVAALSALLALLQNSLALELLAVVAAFLAPILASSGQGSHVVLFSYYLVLNLSIVTVAWFKSWRPLNLAGFAFTFIIATLWGVLRYRPVDFASTEPFLILFFLLYVTIGLLFALRQPAVLRGYVDATLIFGTPIAAFSLQSAMLHRRPSSLAISALVVGAFYLAGAALLRPGTGRIGSSLLSQSFVALGAAFLTLALPLALSGSWTAAAWALEGAALLWIGARQDRALARLAGTLLQFAAGCVILLGAEPGGAGLRLPGALAMSAITVAAACVFGAYCLGALAQPREYERSLHGLLFFWGLLLWLLGAGVELERHVAAEHLAHAELGLAALTALLTSELAQRLGLAIARIPALLLLPVLWLFAWRLAAPPAHPFGGYGLPAWALSFAVQYLVAWRHEGPLSGDLSAALHAGTLWLLALIPGWELLWQFEHASGFGGAWLTMSWAAVPGLLLWLLPSLVERIDWPFAHNRHAYLEVAAPGLALYLGVWIIAVNLLSPGDSQPLRYLPLLNPLDLSLALALVALVRYGLVMRSTVQSRRRRMTGALALLLFAALNGALLRALHQLWGVPFAFDAMLDSTLVQTCLSIFWAVIALAVMLLATRSARRWVWLSGAALLALVVLKLFLVDLSRIGSIERIVSFVGVGVLMLVLGYFSPLPPAAALSERSDS
jgi:uncharacterized membrane protein